jgi:N-acetylmuramoyl-L-alanine amidase
VSAVILDAGHGGEDVEGRATPVGVVGPSGTREKDLTLDVARRVRRIAAARGQSITLTRQSDVNLSLRERIAVARALPAARFVSLHFNGSPNAREQGSEAWVHTRAAAPSRGLAEAVLRRVAAATGLASRGVKAGPLAILLPEAHRADTRACLVELSFLSDPEEETRLARGEYRERIADALAGALSDTALAPSVVVHEEREEFDVWYEVPLVEQLTGMSCWAAAAAMLVGWRDCIAIEATQVARGTGRWEAYREGLEPSDVGALAHAWGLQVEPIRTYTVAGLRDLLVRYGPLWVGEASAGLHVVVLAGMSGDGTPDGTFVRIADPWPVGRGDRYKLTFSEFARNLAAAAALSGLPAKVLHT